MASTQLRSKPDYGFGNLEAARNLAILWEQTGVPVRPEQYASVSAPALEPEVPRPTVTMAVAAFMADARDRGNSEATVYKKHVVFESALLRFCVGKGIRFPSELDLSTLREWRAGWNIESRSEERRVGKECRSRGS